MLEKFSSLDKVHDEVDAESFLEDIVHANNKGVIHLVENEFLNLERIDWVVLDDHILSDALHRVQLPILFATDQIHLAKCATPNDTQQFEVVPCCLNKRLFPEDQACGTVLALFAQQFFDW